MRYWAFVTHECKEEAEHNGFASDIEKLAQKVESDQSIASWDLFLPSPFIKKSMGSWRLLAEKRLIDDEILIIFLRLMSRGNRDYEKFMHSPDTFFVGALPKVEEVRAFLKSKADDAAPGLAPPSQIEFGYLYERLANFDTAEGMIFESKEWVEKLCVNQYQVYLTSFYELICQALQPANQQGRTLSNRNAGTTIVYKYFPNQKTLLLLDAFHVSTLRQENIESRYDHILVDDDCDSTSLSQVARRSYPAVMLAADISEWVKIETNAEGNLAMSPEEGAILEMIQNPDPHDQRVFPLFINGRPGSGKSTVLQYLFADFLLLHLQKPNNMRLPRGPLYLTYSPGLLAVAKQTVKTILNCSYKHMMGTTRFAPQEVKDTLDESFMEFQQFLRSIIPHGVREEFHAGRRIDYAMFKHRWSTTVRSNPDAEIRKIGSEIAWHVIRTYIKGMRDDSNRYLDIEAYSDLPQKQKTVSVELYEKIYDRCWDSWYKPLCDREERWDDQDLARTALNAPLCDTTRYPAVFCDEAQDFTKIELELILNLSLFSKRNLLAQQMVQVPFVFAGDPFQTLNPTGFNWGSVQAGFYEKIVQQLDRTGSARLEFNYQELTYSYRSTKFIVGFCNLIQLLRGVLFNIPGLKPQMSWFDEDASLPSLFDLNDPLCRQHLEEQPELVILIPCQEGEEDDYVKNDKFLSGLNRGAAQVRNFLSPMGAKGLEFSKVVLYKFGDECHQSYNQLLMPLESNFVLSNTPESTLPYEYFLNRLYVASSRARKRLIVVDTDAGIRHFWNHEKIKNPDELLNIYPNSATLGWSLETLSYYQPGNESSWTQDRDDPLTLASSFKDEGIKQGDTYKLRLAEANYQRIGHIHDALECAACRLQFEEKYEEAAEIYLKLSRNDAALKLLWKGCHYQKIASNNRFDNTLEHRASTFLADGKSLTECQSFLTFLHAEIAGPRAVQMRGDPKWAQILNALIQAFLVQKQIQLPSSIVSQLLGLSQQGIEITDFLGLARIASRCGQHVEAKKLFERVELIPQQVQEYFVTMAEVSPFPECMDWYAKEKDYEMIVKRWEENQGSQVDDHAPMILDAYIQTGRLQDALKFLSQKPFDAGFLRLMKASQSSNKSDQFSNTVLAFIRQLGTQGRWREAIELVERQARTVSERKAGAMLMPLIASSDALVARDDELVVLEFLKNSITKGIAEVVSIKVIGQALERTNRLIPCLEYYESIWMPKEGARLDDKASQQRRRWFSKTESSAATADPDIQFAQRRWLKCKEKQVKYDIERGNKVDAESRKDELERRATEWGFELESIPDWEKLEPSPNAPKEIATLRQGSSTPEEKIKAISVLSQSGWKPEAIASALSLSLEEVTSHLE